MIRPFYTVAEVAEMLGWSIKRARRWLRKNRMIDPVVKKGERQLVSASDLLAIRVARVSEDGD